MATLVNLSGNPDIDGLLWGYKWDFTNLTYGFPNTLAPYVGYSSVTGFQSMDTAGYVPLIVRTITLFDSVCGLSFTFQNDSAVANIRYALADSVDMGDGRGSVPTGSAFSTPPDPTEFPQYAWGDGWFSHNLPATPQLGSFYVTAWMTHEPGHGMGLKHGQSVQVDHGVSFPALPVDHDSQEFTVMTYLRYPGDPLGPNSDSVDSDYPTTLMQDDILALQYLYGADYNTNNGNTTYSWSTTTGEMFVNGVGQGVHYHHKVFLTIWDGGGTDTYDMSNFTNGVSIDLRPGHWSITSHDQLADLAAENPGTHLARGNVFNALTDPNNPKETASLIENATGGSGDDTIIGNDINNVLIGGAGSDTILGLGGDDFIQGGFGVDYMDGGAGIDTVDYSYSTEDWTLNLATAKALPASGGVETILNFENVIGGSGNDVITGTVGNNLIRGGAGNDTIDGNDGFDTVVYAGAKSQYTVTKMADESVLVSDSVANRDGIDTLKHIDYLQFADGVVVANITVANVKAANLGVLRVVDTSADASAVAATLDAGQITFTNYINQLITRAQSTTMPALVAYDFFFGKTPASGGVDFLTSFATQIQSPAGGGFSVVNTFVNLAATDSINPSSGFAASFGVVAIPSEQTFFSSVYTQLFGHAPSTGAVNNYFQTQTFNLPNGSTITGNTFNFYQEYVRESLPAVQQTAANLENGARGAVVGTLLFFAEQDSTTQYARATTHFLQDAAVETPHYQVPLIGAYLASSTPQL